MYVPCEPSSSVQPGIARADPLADVADYIYEKKAPLDLALQGIWIGDRESSLRVTSLHVFILHFLLAVIGWDVVQDEIPAVDFVHKYEHVFTLKCVLTSSEAQCLILSRFAIAK